MDFEDDLFLNLDWDPVYLVYLFREEFDDIDYLWNFEIVILNCWKSQKFLIVCKRNIVLV